MIPDKTLTITDIKEILGQLRLTLEKLYGDRLKRLILYGSWARGEATEDSDIDGLVVLKGPVKPGREIDRMLDLIVEMDWKYDILLSIHPVSEEDYQTRQSPLLINVRREGIEI
jgi:predicted nucleotidyltransferase